MAGVAAGPVGRTIDAWARATDGFFRDPSTGEVVLVERPNAQAKALGGVVTVDRVLRGTHVIEPGDVVDVFLQRLAMAMLAWWSIHELRHGPTKYRRTIGAVTLAGAVARTILGDPVHGLAARPRPEVAL